MWQTFSSIFDGLEEAFGTYKIDKTQTNGKMSGRAALLRDPRTKEHWLGHLSGKGDSLGIIPINANSQCKWGCIDIDMYPLDHKVLVQKIRKMKLPLIVCRSKSGGAHCFLFCTDWIDAKDMQQTLQHISASLGYGQSEIFPKQIKLHLDRGDVGNFLNLPYYDAEGGLRYGIKDDGTSATLQEFIELYEAHKQTIEQIMSLQIEETPDTTIKDGPPCLQTLCASKISEGGRNNGLFNIAVYYKQSKPDSWEDEIVKANHKYMEPPLSNSEVQQLIKSVNRKGYDKYRCKDAPINAVCQSGLCRTKRFGVGFGEEEMPILGSLTKYSSTPPQWFLDVSGTRIELKSEQLYSPPLFALACLDQANLVVPVPKAKDWKQFFLKPMMNNLQEVEPLESLDPTNQLTGLLQDWTTNRQSARTMDDVFNKLPFTDENKEFTYFRMDDFYAFLKKNNWEMDKIKTGNLLKRLDDTFVSEERVRIKKQQPRLIKIKTMKQSEASVSKVEYHKEVY